MTFERSGLTKRADPSQRRKGKYTIMGIGTLLISHRERRMVPSLSAQRFWDSPKSKLSLLFPDASAKPTYLMTWRWVTMTIKAFLHGAIRTVSRPVCIWTCTRLTVFGASISIAFTLVKNKKTHHKTEKEEVFFRHNVSPLFFLLCSYDF